MVPGLIVERFYVKLHRFLRYRAEKQADTQTNGSKNPTTATAVGVGKYTVKWEELRYFFMFLGEINILRLI